MVLRRSVVRDVLAAVGLCAVVALVVAGVLVRGSKGWLREESMPGHADVIVVLGGESGQRVIGAAELYHAGVASRVFVSGGGDCLLIVRRLVMAGVPAGRIGHECESGNTMENARMTRRMLDGQPVRSAVLVTSWYHTGRALHAFRRVWPDVAWGARGVFPGDTLAKSFPIYESGSILAEYLKRAWYAVRY
ncbi:YdcF family protein [Ralstonia solanacearum]|uniref:YdcF family protein n=1 Tax=Ralstonia solanacearum TaxID=305 RepID=UPI001B3B3971|nr:YdcF family protein [Ralstonia solanacearum]AST32924.2 YdcF family protein [Ralstonia solanacearum]MDB0507221.1 YdcF family protein [Ralstonia solanacearum]MDB0513131.1 YdcF family protein [Ralstonia solanacearum]